MEMSVLVTSISLVGAPLKMLRILVMARYYSSFSKSGSY
jgi:hypothetical protein